MVTLNDGTIVAAADARWDGSSDGYGLDTIVSHSTDDGATWSYTFANYLGDNGNCLNSSSTAFIDPSLATDGETVYMLVDLYPGGTVISNAQAGTGYDTSGHLMLKASGSSSYDYYLGDFGSDGYAFIYDYSTNTAVGGYTVDQWFNVYVQGTLTSNLFYSDCTYTVLPTSYLYLTTSTDGGATWSAPTMLNSQVKDSEDEFYGVGPGSGLVTSTGRIIFSCYTYVTSDGNTSVIYSDDGGKIWTRSADMSEQSSEATMVEADGTIYMFTRHGGYYYSTDNGTTWSTKQTVSDISYTTSCQLNAMVYSETIDGKTAILLSAPTSNRTTGKIFVGLVQDDGSISWDYTYSVNGSNTYQYSCLAELSDGTVALLYESGSAAITYTTIDIEDIASGATIGSNANETTVTDAATGITATAEGLTSISVSVGEPVYNEDGSISIAYDITLNDGEYTGAAVVTMPVDDAFTEAECNSFTAVVYNDDPDEADDVDVTISDDETTLTLDVPHFSTVLVTGTTSGTTSESNTVDVTLYAGDTYTITDSTGNYEAVYDASDLETDYATVTLTGTSIEASTTVTSVTSATSGSTYYVGDGTNFLVLSGSTLSTTTDITQATEFTWTESSGMMTSRYLSSGSYYLYYNNKTWSVTTSNRDRTNFASYSGSLTTSGGMGSSGTSTGYALYTLTETEASASTTITITGVSEGTTTVTVGNTVYNITVLAVPESAVTSSTSPFVSGTGYASEQKDTTPVTKLTISRTLSYDLNLSEDVLGSDDYTVVWSSADESIATVDQNGTVTGVSAGTTYVTATVTFSDGSTAVYSIPVVVRDDGVDYDTTLKYYDFIIDGITNTTVYMGILYGTSDSNVEAYDLVEVVEGEVIYIAFESSAGTAVDFFANADTGYVITKMSSTDSAGYYHALDNTDPASTAFITTSDTAGAYQVTYFGSTVVCELVQKALDLGCEAGMGWTRQSSNTGKSYSRLTFYAELLPTVEKEITSITRDETTMDYTEGMTLEVGDVITYTITVTEYESISAISYTSAVLTDEITTTSAANATYAAYFSGTTDTEKNIKSDLNSDGTSEETHTYTVTYTLTQDDYDTTITNTVYLAIDYSTAYCVGSFEDSAEATADLEFPSFVSVDLVADFGLPVSYTYTSWNSSVTLDTTKGSATYGDVAVTGNNTSGWKVTYTPTTVLQGVDTVTMYGTNEKEYTFNVYPATTVYYEEGFATYGTGWSVTTGGGWSSTGSTGSDSQEAGVAGSAENNYNYDDAYASDSTGSNGIAASATTVADSLSYTFTGTGTDIFANCDSGSGIVCIMVKNSSGSTEKLLIVDMANTGTYQSGGTAYNTPIASISDLTYGTHTVTIYLASARTTGFAFDGFRVYGTIDESSNDDASAVYTADLEDNPSYYELRNYVLKALVSDTSGSDYADDIANEVAQVYSTSDTVSAIVAYSSNTNLLQSNDAQDLLDDGPKNELYLYNGSTVVFKITTLRQVQIGLRSVTGKEVTYTINGTQYITSSSVDMFYDLQDKSSDTTASEATYTITVTSGGILSITDIKVSDSVGDIFGTLTEAEVVAALTGTTGDSEDEEETVKTEEETESKETADTDESEEETVISVEMEEETEGETGLEEPVETELDGETVASEETEETGETTSSEEMETTEETEEETEVATDTEKETAAETESETESEEPAETKLAGETVVSEETEETAESEEMEIAEETEVETEKKTEVETEEEAAAAIEMETEAETESETESEEPAESELAGETVVSEETVETGETSESEEMETTEETEIETEEETEEETEVATETEEEVETESKTEAEKPAETETAEETTESEEMETTEETEEETEEETTAETESETESEELTETELTGETSESEEMETTEETEVETEEETEAVTETEKETEAETESETESEESAETETVGEMSESEEMETTEETTEVVTGTEEEPEEETESETEPEEPAETETAEETSEPEEMETTEEAEEETEEETEVVTETEEEPEAETESETESEEPVETEVAEETSESEKMETTEETEVETEEETEEEIELATETEEEPEAETESETESEELTETELTGETPVPEEMETTEETEVETEEETEVATEMEEETDEETSESEEKETTEETEVETEEETEVAIETEEGTEEETELATETEEETTAAIEMETEEETEIETESEESVETETAEEVTESEEMETTEETDVETEVATETEAAEETEEEKGITVETDVTTETEAAAEEETTESEDTEESEAETNSEENYVYAEQNIFLVDASGETIASTAISENGAEGETAAFTADEILDQAESVLPDGYAIDESAVSDESVVYGGMGDATITVAKLAAATLEISLVDYRNETLAGTSMTSAMDAEGTSATFTASEILTAVNEVLPDGYAVADKSSITDQMVACGGSSTVSVQIGKTASLVATYQKYSGLFHKTIVGTIVLTKVQTSASDTATFSSDEISGAVPGGYRVLVSTSSKVSYGSAATKTLTVYQVSSFSLFRLFSFENLLRFFSGGTAVSDE